MAEEKINEINNKSPDYKNWIATSFIYIPAAVALFFFALTVLSLYLLIPAIFFAVISIYFMCAYYNFSRRGGDLQNKILDMVLDYLKWNGEGRLLDIGCGNGSLLVKIAKKYPQAQLTGIDYWSGTWGYSKQACENNAMIEGVAGRMVFQKASASKLPFEDKSFDVAVSNFVFHEVRDSKNKRDLIKEALRVVKEGGIFVFHDTFCEKSMYGEIDDLLDKIREWGIRDVKFVRTSNREFVPGFLKLNFMLGAIGIIYGTK